MRPALTIRAGTVLKVDCGFRELDFLGEDGEQLEVKPSGTLWLQRCYVNNYADRQRPVPGPGGWCREGFTLFRGSSSEGTGGAVIRMENTALRWWNQVRACAAHAHP